MLCSTRAQEASPSAAGAALGGGGRIASSRHRSRDGVVLIDTYNLRAHGRELTISERIIGPEGETTRDLTVPLA